MLRTLLVLVLLAPTPLRGQEIEKPASRGKEPAPLNPSVTAQFHVPGQKRAPLLTGRNTFSELRAAFVKGEQARVQENRRRVEAYIEQLRQAGGLQALWKRQLEEASRMNSKEGTPRLPKISTDLRMKIESSAICKTPTLFDVQPVASGEPENLISVGSWAVIEGCHLGESAGTVRLHAPSSGMDYNVTTQFWHDSYIEVSVENVIGVLDQTSVLQATLPSGVASNPIDVFVRAERDFALLAARPNSNALTADCADTTDYDRCASLFEDPQFQQVDHSIGGIHWSRCCFNGVSGTDHYFISLKNGWVLSESPAASLRNGSTITCTAPFGNEVGRFDPPTGFTIGAATTTIDVHWWVDANCSEVLYIFDVSILGPKGVPFE